MVPTARTWWEQLRVKQKVWAVVLVLCVPLIAALVVHFTLIQQLISVQREFNRVLLASDQADILHRLAVDIQGRLDRHLKTLEARESRLAREALWGLLLAVIGGLAFGLLGARLLARSIVRPLTVLRSSVAQLEQIAETSAPIRIPVRSHDEIGQLARVYEEMAGHIQRHIRELEAINIIGNEINTIGPDGLEGVLSRITDRAADMLDVDVCLVMLQDDHMQCWVV